MDTPEQTLAAWRARETELKQSFRETGVARPDQIAGKSGLQVFEAMFAGELPAAPIAATLGFMLVEMRHGYAAFQGRPQFAHYNPLGTVHGGWIATLLDSAVGCSVHSTLAPGKAYTTLELKVNFLRPARPGRLVGTGRVVHKGGTIAFLAGELADESGQVLATATATARIVNRPTSVDPAR